MSCVYVPVFTIRLDLAFGFVCLGVSLWNFVWPYLVLSKSETQIYAWVLSLVVFMFAPGPIMFPMGPVALGSICWPDVVMWNWFLWCLAAPMVCVFIACGIMKRTPIVFSDFCLPPMAAVALVRICWPEVVLWNWFQLCAL